MREQLGGDLSVEMGDGFVATVEIHRPPNNHFFRKSSRRCYGRVGSR